MDLKPAADLIEGEFIVTKEPGAWSFDRPAVAAAFDDHVREQLPWYDLATGVVAHFVRAFLPSRGVVVDVGASTGNIGRAISSTLAIRSGRLIAIEPAREMAARYSGPGECLTISAEDFPFEEVRPDVVVAFLTLQFLDLEARRRVVDRITSSLRTGGVAIVVDRFASRGGYVGQTIGRLTLAAKYEAGAKPAEIIAKELSLVGVQRPLRDDLLVGWVEVFRFGDFAGYIFEA